jgi:hypothetical protein
MSATFTPLFLFITRGSNTHSSIQLSSPVGGPVVSYDARGVASVLTSDVPILEELRLCAHRVLSRRQVKTFLKSEHFVRLRLRAADLATEFRVVRLLDKNSALNAALPTFVSKLYPIIHSKAPAQLLASAHNRVRFLTLYRLHFPKIYPSLKVPLPEQRTDTVWEPSKPEHNCSCPP